MMISRRGLLKGFVAVGALAAMPKVLSAVTYPVLYGDGVSDDAPALQAIIDGKPIVRDGIVYARQLGEPVIIRNGVHKLCAPLVFDTPDMILVENCELDFSDLPVGQPALDIREVSGAEFHDLRIRTGEAAGGAFRFAFAA